MIFSIYVVPLFFKCLNYLVLALFLKDKKLMVKIIFFFCYSSLGYVFVFCYSLFFNEFSMYNIRSFFSIANLIGSFILVSFNLIILWVFSNTIKD